MEKTVQETIEQEAEQDGVEHPVEEQSSLDGASYELAYWLSGKLSQEELQSAKETIRRVVGDAGGKIENETEAARRELAYATAKQTHGYFGVIRFALAPQDIEKIDRALKLEKTLLRFLLVKYEKAAVPVSQAVRFETPRPAARPASAGRRMTERERVFVPSEPRPEVMREPTTSKPEASMEEIEKKLEELLG